MGCVELEGAVNKERLLVRAGLAVVSGLLLPLCFPPYGYWPLLLVVHPLLLIAVDGLRLRPAFYLGMLHGLIGYGLSLYWLFRIFGVVSIALYAITALFVALFCSAWSFVSVSVRGTLARTLAIGLLWTGIEFFRSELFVLRFPWITVGSAMGPTALSPLVGVYGASFLLMVAAGVLAARRFSVALIVPLAVVLLGFVRAPPISVAEGEGIRVAIVQSEDSFWKSYVNLTLNAKEDHPALVVWPEYSVPYDIRKAPGGLPILTNVCGEMEAVLVMGTKTVPGDDLRAWRNTALVVDRDGVLGEYYKARGVHFFDDGIPGTDVRPVETPLGAIGTPICFDCDYTAVIRQMTLAGAEFFAVPSYDAKRWTSDQHLQHALLFRLRAAESGRWLACAASSGVSQIIDPNGNVHQQIPPMEDGVTTGYVVPRTTLTVFVRYGWLFPWLALVSVPLLVMWRLVRCGFLLSNTTGDAVR